MRKLRRQELQETVQLRGIASKRRRHFRRISVVRALQRANLELQPVAKALDPPEHPHCVAFAEPRIEQLDVRPHPRLDAAARVDELEREELAARSPHNVVHLTLPANEADAGMLWREWRGDGVLTQEDEPGFWWLSQDYVGPDGIARRREGLVAA